MRRSSVFRADNGRTPYIHLQSFPTFVARPSLQIIVMEKLSHKRLPIWTESWLGYGHTIDKEDHELLTEGKPFSSVLLTYPAPDFGTMQYAELSSCKSVSFYLIHPLTSEEIDYKEENGTYYELIDRIYPENCDAMKVFLDRMKS